MSKKTNLQPVSEPASEQKKVGRPKKIIVDEVMAQQDMPAINQIHSISHKVTNVPKELVKLPKKPRKKDVEEIQPVVAKELLPPPTPEPIKKIRKSKESSLGGTLITPMMIKPIPEKTFEVKPIKKEPIPLQKATGSGIKKVNPRLRGNQNASEVTPLGNPLGKKERAVGKGNPWILFLNEQKQVTGRKYGDLLNDESIKQDYRNRKIEK
jgi:hypothetical protein